MLPKIPLYRTCITKAIRDIETYSQNVIAPTQIIHRYKYLEQNGLNHIMYILVYNNMIDLNGTTPSNSLTRTEHHITSYRRFGHTPFRPQRRFGLDVSASLPFRPHYISAPERISKHQRNRIITAASRNRFLTA